MRIDGICGECNENGSGHTTKNRELSLLCTLAV